MFPLLFFLRHARRETCAEFERGKRIARRRKESKNIVKLWHFMAVDQESEETGEVGRQGSNAAIYQSNVSEREREDE